MEMNSLPEEKLLKLIRGEKTSAKPLKNRPSAGAGQKTGLRFSGFRIHNLRRLLLGILFMSFLFLLTCFVWPNLFKPKQQSGSLKEVRIQPDSLEDNEKLSEPEVKPYSSYQESISGRQIFSSTAADTPAQLGPTIAQRLKDLNLLGIISGDNLQAVIEDKKTQKTYFLRIGESFESIRIEGIGDGKVTLEIQGQMFDLFL